MKRKKVSLLVLFAAILISLAAAYPIFAELPPRTPTPTASATPTPRHTMPDGAHIVLQTRAGAWSVVQWQDANGDWHDVDGWRGSVVGGAVDWWVAPKDFGTGPFRWVVYPAAGENVSVVSESFYLPDSANKKLIIPVP